MDATVGGGTTITYAHTFTIGTWYHISLRCSSSNVTKLYVDGTQVGSNGTNGGSTSGVNAGFGNANNNPGSNANGAAVSLDELGLWQKELTDTEETWLLNGGDGLPYEVVAVTTSSAARRLFLMSM
jgi:hypothetical protein